MCGIYCHIFCNGTCTCVCDGAKTNLQNRGPDVSDGFKQHVDDIELEFEGHVLHIRGKEAVTQPLQDDDGNVLLWNGEIFGGIEIPDDRSDTSILFELLNGCRSVECFLDVFSRIKGPWAFVYWQNASKKLWFGRDYFGRRSLLWRLPDDVDSCFLLSSVACSERVQWKEVPSTGIFSLNVNGGNISNFDHYEWYPNPFLHSDENIVDIPIPESKVSLLNESSKIKIINRKPGIRCVNIDRFETSCFPLDSESYSSSFETHATSSKVQNLIAVLNASVRSRVTNKPNLCKNCEARIRISSKCFDDRLSSCSHSKVAVLFSGGLDSCILALLADRHIPVDEPIDLLNVAFETVKKQSRRTTSKKNCTTSGSSAADTKNFDVPDRITGRLALEELQKLNPNRTWNFVQINVTIEELQKFRCHVASLLSPCNTVLDDSIGCAIWFASRGSGVILGQQDVYNCPAKIVLVGMGADEQLAGYSRHRVTFKTGKWKGLVKELCMEMNRISCRNLGRDDRIISSHGRESRLPFLDEDVVSFLNRLPVWEKTNLDLPRGVGEKILLRLAAWSLGLKRTAAFPKRAIQFGSRIAKAEDSHEKGSDVCKRL